MTAEKKPVNLLKSAMISGKIYPPGIVYVTEDELQALKDSADHLLQDDAKVENANDQVLDEIKRLNDVVDKLSARINYLENENAGLRKTIAAYEEAGEQQGEKKKAGNKKK